MGEGLPKYTSLSGSSHARIQSLIVACMIGRVKASQPPIHFLLHSIRVTRVFFPFFSKKEIWKENMNSNVKYVSKYESQIFSDVEDMRSHKI
jgi:hypothetical protein